VSEFRTEEEQVAALKKWWKDNGNSLLMGVGVALAIVFGWKAYQNGVLQEKTAASLMYQQLVTAATKNDFDEVDEAETVTYLASELKDKFEGSEYALYAAMFIAKENVADKDYAGAETQLNWALANTEDVRIQHILNARLARLLSAQDKHDEALALLVATDPAFKASYLEIEGDIKNRKGDVSGAVDAYKTAFELVKENPQAQPLLAVKLSSLGLNPDTL
jgi:predicted negative regulator of RcsB-dependent stress response